MLRRGVALINVSRPLEAEPYLRTLLENDSSQWEACLLLGHLYLQRSSLPLAKEFFQRVLDTNPGLPQAVLGLGIVWAKEGNLEQAGRAFDKIVGDRSIGNAARLELIQNLFYQGQDDQALREARDLAFRYPEISGAHSLLGFFYQLRGNAKESLREYQEALNLEPRNLQYYFSLISHYKAQRDWHSALTWAERALVLDTSHPLLHEERASLLARLGRNEESQAARAKARACYDAEVLYSAAAAARAGGRLTEAERKIELALQKNPRLVKAWIDLADRRRESGHNEEALASYTRALEVDPQSRLAHLGLAASLQSLGRDTDAVQAYQRALERGLASPDLRSGLASAYLDQGKARAAAAEMLRAVREHPDHPELISYLGYLQQSDNRPREALESFGIALELNPLQLDALIGRATSALDAGDFRLATASFLRATQIRPESPDAWQGLIHAYRGAGEGAKAESVCRECLSRLPGNPGCRELLASMRLDARDYTEAAREFQALLRSGQNSKSIIDGLAFSLLQDGNSEEACPLFESSLQRYGDDAWVHSNLGYAWRVRRRLDRAIIHYRRAFEMFPRDAEKKQDLALVLYLSGDFSAAASLLESALKQRPDCGTARYYLALTYWNLRQYDLARQHAVAAQSLGVAEAAPVVRALTPQFAQRQRE